MAKLGAFTFVLHSHIPYARQAGRWPHGEEWLHEAAAETYIPLLNTLYDLLEEGLQPRLTLSLTPVLLEQLADTDVQANFETYVTDRLRAAERDIARFDGQGEKRFAHLARYYLQFYRTVLDSFRERFAGDLVRAFRELEERGAVELITCAATHGYLPLLDRDESINLQLHAAVSAHRRHLGRPPRTIWLPECAYRPAYHAADGRLRPGLEDFLAEHGLRLFFAETHMIQGGRPVGLAAGEAIGPYGAVTRRYLVPLSQEQSSRPATVYRPYCASRPEVAVIGRDNRTGLQVWSADWGYPGDFDYREFHKKDGQSGLQYWRVTGADVDLAAKEPYHPDWAASKVKQHAEHFVRLVHDVLAEVQAGQGVYGIVSSNFDSELFGHWWFEGVAWLEQVLRRLAVSESVELTTAGAYLEAHPPDQVIHLPEGSWGAGGAHFVWDNADTHWMWPEIHQAERRMLRSVQAHPEAQGAARAVLNQAARELLLLQASDWPFLVSTGQAKAYAVGRFRGHLERFHILLDTLHAGAPDAALAEELWERDKVFPDIRYEWFAA